MEPDYALFLGPSTGITYLDIILLTMCPIMSAFGMIMSEMVRRQSIADDGMEVLRDGSLGRRALIGFGLGLVISLYFFGAVTNDITSVARILALSILLGYQAPTLFQSQERAIKNVVEKQLEGKISAAFAGVVPENTAEVSGGAKQQTPEAGAAAPDPNRS